MFYNSLIQKGIEAAGKDRTLNKPVGADKGAGFICFAN